jgi:hypothetical protein
MIKEWLLYVERYGIDGSRGQFPQDCYRIFNKIYPDRAVQLIEPYPGDMGVDIAIGAISENFICMQCKFFKGEGLGKVQKNEIRNSFSVAATKWINTMSEWNLCTNINLDIESLKWWEKWKRKQEQKYNNQIKVGLYDGSKLESLSSDYQLRDQIFQEDQKKMLAGTYEAASVTIPKMLDDLPGRIEKKSKTQIKDGITINEKIRPGIIPNELAIRSFLYSKSSIYLKKLSSETFSAHEMNSIYLYRESIKPNWEETIALSFSYLDEKYGFAPFWFWTKTKKRKSVNYLLFNAILNGYSNEIKIHSLELIKKMAPQIKIDIFNEVLESVETDDQRKRVTNLLLGYNKYSLQKLLKSDKLHDQGIKDFILSLIHPRLLLTKWIEQKSISVLYNKKVFESANNLQLLNLARIATGETRLLIIKEILGRPSIESKDLTSLLKKYDSKANCWILSKLLMTSKQTLKKFDYNEYIGSSSYLGSSSNEERTNFFFHLYDLSSKELLSNKIRWLGDESCEIYGYLCTKYFSDYESDITSNLNDAYKSFEEDLLNKELNSMNQSKEQFFSTSKNSDAIRSFTRDSYLYQALKAIIKTGRFRDLNPIRKLLGYKSLLEIQDLAVEILLAIGTEDDLRKILDLCKNGDIKISIRLGNQLQSASTRLGIDISKDLLDLDNEDILPLLLNRKIMTKKIIKFQDIEKFLYNKNESVRISACQYITLNYKNSFIESLLKRYPTNGSYYYYNVIAFFDKYLYAPKSLK